MVSEDVLASWEKAAREDAEKTWFSYNLVETFNALHAARSENAKLRELLNGYEAILRKALTLNTYKEAAEAIDQRRKAGL